MILKEQSRLDEAKTEATRYQEPALLHVLSTAYADAERFEEAEATAMKALRLARARKNMSHEGIRRWYILWTQFEGCLDGQIVPRTRSRLPIPTVAGHR